jgi:hypothetical protein
MKLGGSVAQLFYNYSIETIIYAKTRILGLDISDVNLLYLSSDGLLYDNNDNLLIDEVLTQKISRSENIKSANFVHRQVIK